MDGSALRLGLQVPEAARECAVERLLKAAAEEAGDESVVGLLRPHERRAVARVEYVNVHRVDAERRAAPRESPRWFDLLKRRADRPGTRLPAKIGSFGETAVDRHRPHVG